jgi:hypothetical protein
MFMNRILQLVPSLLLGVLSVSAQQPVVAVAANAESAKTAAWSMPAQADALHLAWVKGPPQLQAFIAIDQHLAGFREEATMLGFRSQRWGMLLDPRTMTLEALTLNDAKDAVVDLLDYSRISQQWSKAQLDLSVEFEGRVYRPRGGALPKGDPHYSPIHIVESGDWFQHVAIYDLELVDEQGELLAGSGRLEIRAWGDRCLFEWAVVPKDRSVLTTRIGLRSEAHGALQALQSTYGPVRLCVDLSGDTIQPGKTEDKSIAISGRTGDEFTLGQPKVTYSELNDCWEIEIPKQSWPSDGATYNKKLLDRISRFDLKLENRSDQPRELCLRFIHDYHSISGYVPMILDAEGRQSGLPLQNSKNWHSLPNKPYPYEGTWINITTRLTLEPHASLDWEYVVAHAQWQGLPASSAAQLSLVGWGFNGFWTQMALGSWGETVCLQPGRTMRRSFITDVRPFMVRGATGKPYDWTGNVGGGDIAKFVDEHGKLIMWHSAVREFGMIGPNLSHVRVTERSPGDHMRLQIDSYLPRSNSINRSYYKVKLDVLKDIRFQECALFQHGSDYYNELDAQQIAWGNGNTLSGQARPRAAGWGRVIEPVQLQGAQPWVSLYDNNSETKTAGRAGRGFVVRDYLAKLGGKEYNRPWLVAKRNQTRLNAELLPDPEILEFKAGDSIEFTVEMDVFPISADAYCGMDQALQARLAATPDSWELTAYEAVHQGVSIDGVDAVFPATLAYDGAQRQQFKLSSRSGMDTVCVTGLPQPDAWRIGEWIDGAFVELGQRFAVEAEPQIVYLPESNSWTAVLSLVFPEGNRERNLVVEVQ